MRDATIDSFDRAILSTLQNKGDISLNDLSNLVNLSSSQCSRRLQRLKDEGYIDRVVAILSPAKLNLNVSSFVVVKLYSHSPEIEKRFCDHISRLNEVVSCHYITGSSDFILLVYSHDLHSYREFIAHRLLSLSDITSITSHIILGNVKNVTTLPLDYT
ncbi:Lrp/AsnC family transcriptional regulator [Acetobacter tropicalis]|uniref:Lrp/AsnC family transcriptional regulator n=1 Tax=Acetobacter TaxID=434 RepID=UPI001EDC24A1|nr:Lrp/AsnC family transcriptional regulator [Acetobacter senegalensis]MCG4254083.1 Lrp/AsnC family transcriptional regulator [Acetobacter senegalensis]MCP1194288.1 Lrp/AsnC family transcriptional regulator [Acetobacter senegalensis]